MSLFDFNTNLKSLAWTMFLVFLGLTLMIVYYPANEVTDLEPLPNDVLSPLSQEERRGLEVYVHENCMACHTQQVRNIEMDKTWGSRPTIEQDYLYSKRRLNVWVQSPSLLGSERTGPDLTDVGRRKGSMEWQLLHLYEPRAVESKSIMPSFRWLFNEIDSTMIKESDVVVSGIPDRYIKNKSKKVVAKSDAIALAKYLLSLKQPDLPNDMEAPKFIPLKPKKEGKFNTVADKNGPDGKNLFENTCATCHQSTGKGVPGAFPSLVNSPYVNDDNPESHIRIVLEGKNDDPDYGPMPPQGNGLSDEEIAAILNYERTSWGNTGKEVSADDVKEIRNQIK